MWNVRASTIQTQHQSESENVKDWRVCARVRVRASVCARVCERKRVCRGGGGGGGGLYVCMAESVNPNLRVIPAATNKTTTTKKCVQNRHAKVEMNNNFGARARGEKVFFFCERCNGGSRAAQPGSNSSNRPTDRIFASILINSQRRSAATTAAASSCRRTHTHLIQCTAVSSTSSSPFVVVHWAPRHICPPPHVSGTRT